MVADLDVVTRVDVDQLPEVDAPGSKPSRWKRRATRSLSRLAGGLVTLVIVTLSIFVLIDFAPDAAAVVAGEGATVEEIDSARERLGLNDPLIERYVSWVGDAGRGDLGDSLITNEPVTTVVLRALPATLSLAIVAMVMSTLIALIAGVLAALRPNGFVDRTVTLFAALGISMPSFWLGLILISQFAVERRWFPPGSYSSLSDGPWEWLRHLILPGIALSAVAAGELARQLRGAMNDVLARDYVLAARAKGLSKRRVVLKHALKNAAIPVVTVAGVRFVQTLGGAVVVEQIFNIRGIGLLTIGAVRNGDIPVVLGVVVVATIVAIVTNLLVDCTYGFFNPKLRDR